MSQLRVHPVCMEMLPLESSHRLFPGTDMHQELKSQESRTPYLKKSFIIICGWGRRAQPGTHSGHGLCGAESMSLKREASLSCQVSGTGSSSESSGLPWRTSHRPPPGHRYHGSASCSSLAGLLHQVELRISGCFLLCLNTRHNECSVVNMIILIAQIWKQAPDLPKIM